MILEEMPKRCIFKRCHKNKTEKISLFKITPSRFEAWRNIIPNLKLNQFICTKHFLDEDILKGWESGGISFQYVIPRLKDTAMPIKVKDDLENYVQFKLMGGAKRLKRDVIPHKFCDPQQSTSYYYTAKQNQIRHAQENMDMCLESNITIKDEFQIKSDPLDVYEEPALKFVTQESETLSNIKTEPSDLDSNSVYDKDMLLVKIKTESSDIEEQSENVLQPLATILLPTNPTYNFEIFDDENFLDDCEDPLGKC